MEKQRTHPLIITAAVAVILASSIAVASMTGLLPKSQANISDQPVAELDDSASGKEKLAASKDAEPVRKAAPKPAANKPAPVQTAAACNTCGRVVEVRQRTVQGEGSGIGAVAGGVVGGLLGNQIGGGNGRKVATAAGVVGGAVLGNKIEKDRNASTQYDVVVQYDNGGSDVFSFSNSPSWQSGDRVKVVNGQITSSL
jgi:outer membrane lipoprotein SlyB